VITGVGLDGVLKAGASANTDVPGRQAVRISSSRLTITFDVIDVRIFVSIFYLLLVELARANDRIFR
jgi:hypothetical protein